MPLSPPFSIYELSKRGKEILEYMRKGDEFE